MKKFQKIKNYWQKKTISEGNEIGKELFGKKNKRTFNKKKIANFFKNATIEKNIKKN